jgi:hypothetical protein
MLHILSNFRLEVRWDIDLYLSLSQVEMEPTGNFDSRQEICLDGQLKWCYHYCITNQVVCVNE